MKYSCSIQDSSFLSQLPPARYQWSPVWIPTPTDSLSPFYIKALIQTTSICNAAQHISVKLYLDDVPTIISCMKVSVVSTACFLSKTVLPFNRYPRWCDNVYNYLVAHTCKTYSLQICFQYFHIVQMYLLSFVLTVPRIYTGSQDGTLALKTHKTHH